MPLTDDQTEILAAAAYSEGAPPMTDKTPDYAAARDYAARVLAHPDKHGTEEVAAARVLQQLLPAPNSTLTAGSTWGDGHDLESALKQSPYTRAAVADRDNDLAAWADGYWDGAGFHPDASPDEGPWKIIWLGTEQ